MKLKKWRQFYRIYPLVRFSRKLRQESSDTNYWNKVPGNDGRDHPNDRCIDECNSESKNISTVPTYTLKHCPSGCF